MLEGAAIDTEKQSRIANRQSFFGGTVSTRAACTAPSWTPVVPKAEPDKPKAKGGEKGNREGSTKGNPVKRQEVDPKKELLKRLKAERATYVDAYAALEDAPIGTTPPPSQGTRGPSAKPKLKTAEDDLLSAAAKYLTPSAKSAGSSGGANKTGKGFGDGFSQQAGRCWDPLAASSRGTTPISSHGIKSSCKVKVVPPSRRGKGAAGLAYAVMPQAVSRSQKQIATDALRASIQNLRQTTPPAFARPAVADGERSRPKVAGQGTAPEGLRASSMPSKLPGQTAPRLAVTGNQPRYPAQASKPLSRPVSATLPVDRRPARPMDSDLRGRTGAGALRGRLPGSKKRRPGMGYDSDEDSLLDDFVEEDDDGGDWRKELKSITGYDPHKYKNEVYDDRRMVASFADIRREEVRSLRAGREEDAAAEAELLAAAAAKAAAKKKAKKAKTLVD